jgi:hypothetical protein
MSRRLKDKQSYCGNVFRYVSQIVQTRLIRRLICYRIVKPIIMSLIALCARALWILSLFLKRRLKGLLDVDLSITHCFEPDLGLASDI